MSHDVHQHLVRLDLGERDGDDRPIGRVRERLDERRLARARWAVKQEADLMREAGLGELAALVLKVVEQREQRLLVVKEERVERLVVGELVPLVLARVVLLVGVREGEALGVIGSTGSRTT